MDKHTIQLSGAATW